MAIIWQSDGNQMAILPFSYTHETQSQSHSPTHSPPAMPTHHLKNAITTPPPRSQSNSTHPLLPPCNHPLDLETTLRVPLHLPLCHCLFVASCRRAIRSTVRCVVIRNSNQRSSRKGKSLKLDRMRGVPADARSSVLNLSSTRPFSASDCRLKSQSNVRITTCRRKYHNHTPAEVRSSSKRRLSSSRHAATLRLLCS